MSGRESAAAVQYRERRDRFAAEAAELEGRSRAISNARLATALVAIGCLGAFLVTAFRGGPLWLSLAGLAAIVFAVLVSLHDRVIRKERRAATLATLNADGATRLERDFTHLPLPDLASDESATDGFDGARGDLARDLRLFGRASLFHLVGTAHTPPGKATLARWLLEPATPTVAQRRHGAVRELAERLELRQELELRARRLEPARPDPEPFLVWAEGEPWLRRRPALLWLGRLLPLVGLTLAGLAFAGRAPFALWGLAALANVGLCMVFAKRTWHTLATISAREGGFLHYGEALAALETETFEDPLLAERIEGLRVAGRPASGRMRQLHKRVVLSDVRYSGSLSFVLQALFAWDLQMIDLLERWQEDSGRQARSWLTSLGEIEALSAFGTLAWEQPDWRFPELLPSPDAGGATLQAEGLGHPLLPDDRRVGNDVRLGPPGSFLLVTGSNMSGKSTLLRSIGLNVVLAQAGAPVCAQRLVLPPVELGTSILVEDSLESGLSYFMAELARIKAIVDRARICQSEGRTLLFLLDEILRGTNAVERLIAVERVIGHLLEAQAIGAVSTHDLGLADAEALRAACRPVHLRETLHPEGDGPPMTFDYRLREGVCPTTNALKLLELVGLGDA